MITIFWARFVYLNPGIPQLMQELSLARHAGARVVDVTITSLERVAELANESTAIVIDQSIYNAATWVVNEFGPYYVYDLRERAHYDAALDILLAAPAPRLFGMYFDLHDIKNFSLINRIAGKVDAISWMFERRPLAIVDVPAQYRDSFLTGDYDPVGAWDRVRALFPVRIEQPFALGESDLVPATAPARWDACVAGAPYLTRQTARHSLQAEGIGLAPYNQLNLVVRAGNRVLPKRLFPRRASELSIAYSQAMQRTLVRGSSVNFVCGGALSFPARKFFEIPGARRAMVAYPCIGFEDYGFQDGVNAIVSAPEDVGKTTRRLLSDNALRERVANAAWELVRERHSTMRRATELLESAQRLAAGRLRGAAFVRGEFEFW